MRRAPPTTISRVDATVFVGNKSFDGELGEENRDKGSNMFFLLRMAFWLTVILAVLPAFVTREAPPTEAAAKFSAGEAFSAATATVSDLAQFCTRRPETCAVGAQAAAAVGANAQAGVKILYDYVTEKSGTSEAPRASAPRKSAADRQAPKTTGSISARMPRDTLLPADLAPSWRGPNSPESHEDPA
jgi:hypothetical protein